MKKVAFAIIATLGVLTACGGAFAGTPTAVSNVTGTVVYGTEQALSVEKDTSSGNRAKVRYSSGFQYVTDDAAWSRHAKIVSGFVLPVVVPGSQSGLTYDISKSNGIYCTGGGTQSQIAWPNVGMADTLSDACGLFNAAKAAAQ